MSSGDEYEEEAMEEGDFPVGLKWSATAQRMGMREETIGVLADRYKEEPEELAGIFNFMYTRHPSKTRKIRQRDYDIIKKGTEDYLEKRVKGIGEPITLMDTEVYPAPTASYKETKVRGLSFKSGKVSARSLTARNLLKNDFFGNIRYPTWENNKDPKLYTNEDLAKGIDDLIEVRDRYAKWLMCLGYAKETLKLLQTKREESLIWTGRVTFYRATNMDPTAMTHCEAIEALQWEILMMYRLVPKEKIPRDYATKDPHGDGRN